MSICLASLFPSSDIRECTTDAVIIPLYVDEAVPVLIRDFWRQEDRLRQSFGADKGQVYMDWLPDGKRILFVGLGKPINPAFPYTPIDCQSIGGAVAKAMKAWKVFDAVLLCSERCITYDVQLGILLGDFEYTRKSKKTVDPERTVRLWCQDNRLHGEKRQEQQIKDITALAAAITSTRDIVSAGANEVTPKAFCLQAKLLAENNEDALWCRVLTSQDLEQIGARLILAVSKGSAGHSDHEPALIHMTYAPPGQSKDPEPGDRWIIGKGVMFDSGGLNIKPGEAMRHMRIDMAGAAACLGLMRYIAETRPAGMRVHVVMPVTDNMTGPMAYKVGDVYTAMSGKTVEIGNTDAEGRLVLADAMTYAQRKGARNMVTVATLTGAQMVALASTAAVFANQHGRQTLSRLLQAGIDSGEPVHELPLDRRLLPLIRSKAGADICNVSMVPTQGGSTTAALFLSEFVDQGVGHVHLDISGAAYPWYPWGLDHVQNDTATGFGVALLVNYLFAV